jgi:hypothetical protein
LRVSLNVAQIRELVDAITAGDKERIDALAAALGLRVDWHGTHFRLRRGARSVVCSLEMPRAHVETQMRVLFGRLWSIASG